MKSLRLVGISDAPIIFRTVWQWRTKSLERHGSGYNRQNKKVRPSGHSYPVNADAIGCD